MVIRGAEVSDLSRIAQVHVDSMRDTYQGIMPDSFLEGLTYPESEEHLKEVFEDKNSFFYVAENDNHNVVGFAIAGLSTSKQKSFEGELFGLYILPDSQRQGIGGDLVSVVAERFIESGYESMLVWVLADNPAVEFYSQLGGEEIDEQVIEIGNKKLKEIAIGWEKIDCLV